MRDGSRVHLVGWEVSSLIAAAKVGDDAALGQLAELYRDYLLHIATAELGGDLRAKLGASDLVQEALVDFKTTISQIRGDSDADLRAYLRQVILNRAANAGRRFRQTGKRDIAQEIRLDAGVERDRHAGPCRRELADRAMTPRSSALANERDVQVRVALTRLPDDYRKVIELRDIEDRTWDEVGAALERSSDAARQLWYRAIDELRQVWERMDGDRSD